MVSRSSRFAPGGLCVPAQSLVLGEECERAKPHPDPYLVGAKNIGVALDEVFAVEDSPSGAPAAALLLCLFRTGKVEGQRENGPGRGCEIEWDTGRQGVRFLYHVQTERLTHCWRLQIRWHPGPWDMYVLGLTPRTASNVQVSHKTVAPGRQ